MPENSTPTRAIRVLILWADDQSPNLGVRVLARGTAALARGVWPDAEITFQNYGSRRRELPIGRLRSLIAERFTGRRGMQAWFRNFDVAIDTRAGDSFTDAYGLQRHAVMTAVGLFAAQAGVPVVLGPQTIGPFETRRGRLLARATLRTARAVLPRDSASAAVANALGYPVAAPTTDVVFSLPVPQADPVARDVILNVSGLLWNENPHVDAERYRATVQQFARQLVTDGRRLTLLPHVVHSGNDDSDLAATQELHELLGDLGDAVDVIVPLDLDDARALLASARVVIGSRMHACLNALSVGVAAVPLGYSDKFAPLLGDLGWRWGVDLRTDDHPVASALRELVGAEAADVAAVRREADIARHGSELALAGLRIHRTAA